MGSSDKARQTSASNAKNPDAPDPTYLVPCPLPPFAHHFSTADKSEHLKGGGLNLESRQSTKDRALVKVPFSVPSVSSVVGCFVV